MAEQDVKVPNFLIASAASLVLLFVVIFLLVQFVTFLAPERELAEEDMQRMMAAAEERIESPAQVRAGAADEPDEVVDLQSGSEVYQNTCAACHDTGTAGAPITGEPGDWGDERIEQGFDTMVQHVIDGLGAMPPRGGDSDLSDDEVRWSVAHMMAETDIDLDGVEAALEEEEQALSGNGDGDAEEVAEEDAAEEAVAEDVSMDELDPSAGRTVYNSSCASCHTPGVAGAPETGDRGAWEARLDKGLAVLIEHAIEGFQGDDGFMPPRGGDSGLSDEEVANAVAFMIEESE